MFNFTRNSLFLWELPLSITTSCGTGSLLHWRCHWRSVIWALGSQPFLCSSLRINYPSHCSTWDFLENPFSHLSSSQRAHGGWYPLLSNEVSSSNHQHVSFMQLHNATTRVSPWPQHRDVLKHQHRRLIWVHYYLMEISHPLATSKVEFGCQIICEWASCTTGKSLQHFPIYTPMCVWLDFHSLLATLPFGLLLLCPFVRSSYYSWAQASFIFVYFAFYLMYLGETRLFLRC